MKPGTRSNEVSAEAAGEKLANINPDQYPTQFLSPSDVDNFWCIPTFPAGTQQGKENSRMYNEMVILKLVQSMTKLITSPPEVFKEQIHEHFRHKGENFYQRIKSWMKLSETDAAPNDKVTKGEGLMRVCKFDWI